jgi:predicted small lipoprotein YifL
MKLRPWLLIATAALALGACGKRGALERPPPLWGKDKAAAEAQEGKDKAEGAQVERSGNQKPKTPETRNIPISTDRVETGKSDPVGASPVEPH